MVNFSNYNKREDIRNEVMERSAQEFAAKEEALKRKASAELEALKKSKEAKIAAQVKFKSW